MNEKKDYYDLDDLFDNAPKNINKKVEDNFLEKRAVKIHNDTYVKDKVYECAKCKNKGKIAYLNEEGRFAVRDCECYRIRANRRKMERLGLLTFLDENNSFDAFLTKEKWQEEMKNKAIQFINNSKGNWFFVGGNVGSGKTKLCAIIFSKLLEIDPNQTCEYLQWDSDYKNLTYPTKEEKAEINARIEDYKNCDILYIDDFIRVKSKSDFKTDVANLAKSIINYRYMNNKTTIISSELYYNELEEMDEATGSRIFQRCKNGEYLIVVGRNKARNMRKDIEII